MMQLLELLTLGGEEQRLHEMKCKVNPCIRNRQQWRAETAETSRGLSSTGEGRAGPDALQHQEGLSFLFI